MSKRLPHPVQPSLPGDHQRALAKLQRLYGRNSVAPDAFGRRPALPSEIERVVKARQQPTASTEQPRKRERR